MRALSEAMVLRMGSNAFLKSSGIPSATLSWKLEAEHLGRRCPEGFDRATDVGDQLRTAPNEHFAGVQKRQVSLGLLTPVLERVQKLGINSGQPGQSLRVELVTFTLVAVDEVELSGVCDQELICPHSSSSRLTQGEWVPTSMAMRRSGCSESNRRLMASGVVRSLPS